MGERLQKFLARAGVASRRRAERLILEGRVAVNGKPVAKLGARVEPADRVAVDGREVAPPADRQYFVLYKPSGVVTTLADPQGRSSVADWVRGTSRRLFPVGRLDYDAEGALIMTDDGALAHRLAHPRFGVRRTYLAKVKGSPDGAALERLRRGVYLDDGVAKPVSVEPFGRAERNTWLAIVVDEGRPHLIKRLCAAAGHPVARLFRPSYAGVGVAGMKPGDLRPLRAAEERMLQAAAAGRPVEQEQALFLPPRRHRQASEPPARPETRSVSRRRDSSKRRLR